PQHRRKRRERVVPHLGLGPSQPPQQRGLPRIGQPHQPHVRKQLQPNLDPPLLPRGPLLREPRRLPRGGSEPLVPMPPTPPMRNNSPLPGLHKVHPTPIHSLSLRPGRHRNLQLVPTRPVAIGALAMPTRPSTKVLATTQRTEIATRRIANQH